MKIVREHIYESVIAKEHFNLKIDYGIETTEHSKLRQYRHKNYISDETIYDNVKAAMNQLLNDLIFDELDIEERVIIKNIDTDLNIVGVPKKGNDDTILFKLITVMVEKDFRNPFNTKIIEINNNDLK